MVCRAVFLFSFMLCHAVCECVLPNAVLCVVLCRDVLGLHFPEGLIKADTETGCITALMKSVTADYTRCSSQCNSTREER